MYLYRSVIIDDKMQCIKYSLEIQKSMKKWMFIVVTRALRVTC
jgi:hypothetical protein